MEHVEKDKPSVFIRSDYREKLPSDPADSIREAISCFLKLSEAQQRNALDTEVVRVLLPRAIKEPRDYTLVWITLPDDCVEQLKQLQRSLNYHPDLTRFLNAAIKLWLDKQS